MPVIMQFPVTDRFGDEHYPETWNGKANTSFTVCVLHVCVLCTLSLSLLSLFSLAILRVSLAAQHTTAVVCCVVLSVRLSVVAESDGGERRTNLMPINIIRICWVRGNVMKSVVKRTVILEFLVRDVRLNNIWMCIIHQRIRNISVILVAHCGHSRKVTTDTSQTTLEFINVRRVVICNQDVQTNTNVKQHLFLSKSGSSIASRNQTKNSLYPFLFLSFFLIRHCTCIRLSVLWFVLCCKGVACSEAT